MFTGIIQDIGRVQEAHTSSSGGEDLRFVIETAMDLSATAIGASIACNGCCLTVVEKGASWFAVDVSAETLSKTSLGSWAEDSRINLEPALRMGDELGGHIVLGHIDGVAEIICICDKGGSHPMKIKAPAELAGFIAQKGSVTLDGISLTVNEVEGDVFKVNIIPHTWEATTLSGCVVGSKLNIEIDMLARYVARMNDVEKERAA